MSCHWEDKPWGRSLQWQTASLKMVARPSLQPAAVLEVLLNLLILACSSVSYNSTGGCSITSLGSLLLPVWRGLQWFQWCWWGKAQQLDIQFYQLKLPTVTVAMACSRPSQPSAAPPHPGRSAVRGTAPVAGDWRCAAHAYCRGIRPRPCALFPQPLGCLRLSLVQREEALYQSKGYSGFSCSFHGETLVLESLLPWALGSLQWEPCWPSGVTKGQGWKEKPAEMLEFRLFKTFRQTWVMEVTLNYHLSWNALLYNLPALRSG